MKNIEYDKKSVAFFRVRKIDDKYLITNNFGFFAILRSDEYSQYLSGKLKTSNPSLYEDLAQKGFIKDQLNFPKLIERFRSKNFFLKQGPSLHIVVVTLRGNHKRMNYHASAGNSDNNDLDMGVDLAKDLVDMVFKSNSQFVAIEFRGGEPLLNWETVKFTIEYAREKEKMEKKDLNIMMVSNFSAMDENKLSYLLKNKVSLSTSLDGPEKLHNKNRTYLDGNSYENTIGWLKKANNLYGKKLEKFRPGVLTTITKYSFPYFRELVDEYIALGMHSIYLRPLNAYGFTKKTWQQIGYTTDEYIDFYKKTLDYIIEVNLDGKKINEYLASVFLTKILTETDPNHSEYRSPCGAGTGQLAYNYNGDVYTCDDGRILGRFGDYSFKMGNIQKDTYDNIIESGTVKSCAVSSCLDTLPGCCDCVYKPYCGVCPIYNYMEQGSIFGQMATNERCKLNKTILDYLFELMQNKKIEKIFQSWVNK